MREDAADGKVKAGVPFGGKVVLLRDLTGLVGRHFRTLLSKILLVGVLCTGKGEMKRAERSDTMRGVGMGQLLSPPNFLSTCSQTKIETGSKISEYHQIGFVNCKTYFHHIKLSNFYITRRKHFMLYHIDN